MAQKATADGGENSNRDVEAGDRVQAGDLVEGDIVTPVGDDDAHYEVVEIWREEDSIADPLRVKLQDDDGNEDVVVGTVSRHYLVEHAGESDEVETYSLEVDPDTVIQGLKINSKPGEQRTVLFRPKVGASNYGEGVLRDVRGLMWDGEAPPQIRPEKFLSEDVGDFPEARSEGKRIAEEEGEDREEGAEIAAEEWESQARSWLQEEIVVEARFEEESRTVYNIEYTEGGE